MMRPIVPVSRRQCVQALRGGPVAGGGGAGRPWPIAAVGALG